MPHHRNPKKNWKRIIFEPSNRARDFMLRFHHIGHSMSRTGTPTDNAAMEAINGWLKSELFIGFHITGKESIERRIKEYIKFFNEERPAYALGYVTPKQYREAYSGNGNSKKKWKKEIYPYCI